MRNPLEAWRGGRSPFRELQNDMQRFQSKMEQLFEEMAPLSIASIPSAEAMETFNPRCDVSEDKANYYLKFDIPGVSKDQIKVELANNTLTVSAERKEERKKEDQKKYLSEVFYGSYVRSFTLPNIVKESKIEAHFENGVLTLTIPKTEVTQTKQIAVH
jgi:HSP20 family protein